MEALDDRGAEPGVLTRMEMNTIMKGTGLTEEEAWQESRHLFCLAPAPNLGR